MSFDKLGLPELRRTAEEDFAVSLSDDEKKSKKLILTALHESGVTFAQYLECNPDQKEKFGIVDEAPQAEEKAPENVVTSAQATGTEAVEIVTKEERPNLTTNQQWLVKMERQNPLFEVHGPSGKMHKFTQDHPYVLMDAVDAEVVLREDGFRQAYPSEVSDYYQ